MSDEPNNEADIFVHFKNGDSIQVPNAEIVVTGTQLYLRKLNATELSSESSLLVTPWENVLFVVKASDYTFKPAPYHPTEEVSS